MCTSGARPLGSSSEISRRRQESSGRRATASSSEAGASHASKESGLLFSLRFDGAPRRLRSRIESVAGAMRDAAFNKSSHCFRAILCFVIPVCSSFRVACMNFFRGRLGVSLADRAGSKHTCFAADLFSPRPPFAEIAGCGAAAQKWQTEVAALMAKKTCPVRWLAIFVDLEGAWLLTAAAYAPAVAGRADAFPRKLS